MSDNAVLSALRALGISEDIRVIGGTTEWFDADPEWKPIETIRLIMKDGVIHKNTL